MADDPPNHFFKFIPPAFLFNLSIPKSFIAKLNEWRCKKKAILRRGSHKWTVEINSDRGVFGDGWKKFVNDNGVQELDFIVFKHQGNMVFEVYVFDQSTCERHYCYPPEDESVTETPADSLDTHRHKMLKMVKCKPAAKRTSENPLSESERKDDDDCSFVYTMTPFCIKKAILHVPKNFARSKGLFNNIGDTHIVIMDEIQRSWIAKLKVRISEIHLMGWLKLVLANHLESGDVCKFELVKSGKVPLYKFYKLGKKPNIIHMQVGKEPSYFISTLNKWNIKNSQLHFPKEFARMNGLFQKEKMILKNVKGNSWTMEIKNFRNKLCYIQHGWKAFRVANKLRQRERFKLELVSNDEIPIAYFYSLKIR